MSAISTGPIHYTESPQRRNETYRTWYFPIVQVGGVQTGGTPVHPGLSATPGAASSTAPAGPAPSSTAATTAYVRHGERWVLAA